MRVKSGHYYGSELNKFIDENCTRQMTCINIDCLLLKNDQKKVRFIEFKHSNEHFPLSQFRALKILHLITSQSLSGWDSRVFVVRGNYPFDDGAKICSLSDLKAILLTREDLIKWLNFEKELDFTTGDTLEVMQL